MAKKKSLNKEDRTLIVRIIALLLLVGLILPLLNVLVVQGPDWPSRIDFLFHIQQPYMIVALIIVIFAYLAWSKRAKVQDERAAPRLALGLLAAALFCLVLWSHLQFFTALDAGAIRVTQSEILYDYGGLLGVRWPKGETLLISPNMTVKDTVILGKAPKQPILSGIASVTADGTNGRVLASVNGYPYDLRVTEQFSRFDIPLEAKHLKTGANDLEFSVDTSSTASFAHQFYYPSKSRIESADGELQPSEGKILVWIHDAAHEVPASEGFQIIGQVPGRAQVMLFKLRPLLLFTVTVLVFLSILGIRTCIAWLKAAELEAYSSVLLSLLMLQFVEIVKNHWYLLSTIVVGAVGRILGVFYGEGVQYVTSGLNCPVLRLLNMTVHICKSSSGVESAGYFTMLFLLVLVTNWKELNRGKMLLFYVVGLAGAVLVNVIRITLLLLVGVYVSPEFSMGIFHTNIGWILFLVYSAVYWYALLPFVRKKK